MFVLFGNIRQFPYFSGKDTVHIIRIVASAYKGSIKSNNNKYLYFIFSIFFIPFLISNASIVGSCPSETFVKYHRVLCSAFRQDVVTEGIGYLFIEDSFCLNSENASASRTSAHL